MLMRLALRSLRRNPRRTATILLTVGLGAASLFVFHGFNAGVMNQYREFNIHSRYGYGQINTQGYRDQVFEKPWEHWISNWSELKPELQAVPGVQKLFPRVDFFAMLSNGKVNIAGRGQGVEGELEADFFTTLNIEQGKMLTDEPDGIMIGIGVARTLKVKPGDRVTVLTNTIHGSMNGGDFTVTGIFHSGMKDYDDSAFRIPLKQAQLLLDTDKIEHVTLGLGGVDDWKNVAAFVKDKHPELEATGFATLDKVYYQHSVDWLDAQFGVIESIILMIVILGIFNTVSTAVLERRQEIGNMRANGESRGDIIALLGSEGIVLGVVGALLGIAIALALNLTVLRNGILMPPAPGLTRQFHVMVELQVMMAVKAFLMSSIAAMIGTLMAGIKVARMPIGEALRSL